MQFDPSVVTLLLCDKLNIQMGKILKGIWLFVWMGAMASLLGQNGSFPWALGAGARLINYQAHPGETSLQHPYFDPTVQLTAAKYLNGAFDFRTQLTLGPQVHLPGTEGSQRGLLVDMSYQLVFKLHNGVLLRESARLSPYFIVGVGGSYLPNRPDAYLPVGGGLRYRFGPRASINLETVRQISLNRDYQHLAHALAFVYNLDVKENPQLEEIEQDSTGEQVLAMLNADRDQDGVPDLQDQCPDLPGRPDFQGCPEEMTDKLAGEEMIASEFTMGEPVDLSESLANEEELPADLVDASPVTEEPMEALVAQADPVEEEPLLPAETPSLTQESVEVEEVVESTTAEEEAIVELEEEEIFIPTVIEESVESEVPNLAEADLEEGGEIEFEVEIGDLDTAYVDELLIEEATTNELVEVAKVEEDVFLPEMESEIEELESTSSEEQALGACEALKQTELDPIFFEEASDKLGQDAKIVLDGLAKQLASCEDCRLIIQGHTDAKGGDEYNQILSVLRAYNVKYYLVYEHGISQSRITSGGAGEHKPLADNGTDQGRQQNRRVDFKLGF